MKRLLVKAGPCPEHGATVATAATALAETHPGEEGTHRQAHDRTPGAVKKNSQDEKECGGRGQGRPLGKVALEEEPTRGEVNKHANKQGKNVLEETAVQSPGWGGAWPAGGRR